MSIYQTTTIKLDMDNLHLYEMQLNNLLMLYGDAGEEARTQIAFDITKIKPKKRLILANKIQEYIKRILKDG